MEYTTIKALHIIFMVTWFAGLFYIVRLFIYHRAALQDIEPQKTILASQFSIMEKRLWYAITWPSAILCTLFGVVMLYLNQGLLSQGFMHVKLAFVFALICYHLFTHWVFKSFQRQESNYSDMFLLFMNEVPTVLLIAVVFLIIRRDTLSWVSGIVGIVGVAILLSMSIKIYQRMRK